MRDAAEESQGAKALPNVRIDELNRETIRSYRMRYENRHEGHPWNDLPSSEFLRCIGAAAETDDGTLHPTGAGLLMFGNDWRIHEEFPEYFLDYRQQISPATRWQDRVVSQGGDWSGNVYDFYYRIYNLMKQTLRLPFKLEEITRVDDTPAHRALREALANCLTNANYHERRGVVCIWEEGAITIANPGDFRVDIERAKRGGESDPRNKNMMQIFSYIDVGERAGSGLPKIFGGWRECGYADPSYEEQFGPDRTILTLPLMPAGPITTQVTTQVEALLSAMGNGTYSTVELMGELGLSSRKNFMENYLNPALAADLVERTIPNKPNSRLQRYRRKA